jgi:phosphoribosylanthranilate isomerase
MIDLFPTRVKVCGITNLHDALAAVGHGARTLGFVFHPPSPLHVSAALARAIIEALPPEVITIGVFVDRPPHEVAATAALSGLSAVQLHGQEPDHWLAEVGLPAIKALRVRTMEDLDQLGRYPSATAYLLDAWSPAAAGGTGQAWDWALAQLIPALDKPWALAGGLGPHNVQLAIRQVRPAAVDVSSGVEARPGVKDHALLQAFITQAQEAFHAYGQH